VLCSDDGEEIVDVRGPISSDEMEFVLRAAIAGAGVAALPSQLVHEPLMRLELEVALPGYHLRGADLHVVLPSAAFVPTRVMLLRDHLVRAGRADTSAREPIYRHSRTPADRARSRRALAGDSNGSV